MSKRKNPVSFSGKGQQEGNIETTRMQNLAFTFSKEKSANVKGHSVNVVLISAFLSSYISLTFSSLFLCLFPGDRSNGVE